jgi:hypothetical protein
MTPLSTVTEAAWIYAYHEGEEVHIVSARSLNFANRYFRVEGTHRAFRRTYLVDLSRAAPFVFEAMGVHHSTSDEDLILLAQRSKERLSA